MFSLQGLGDHGRNVPAPTRTRVKASPCHFFNLPPEIRNRWPTYSCFPRQMLTDDGGILASDVQVWGRESLRRIQCIDFAIFWHEYVLSSSTTGPEPQWEVSKTTPISETRDWDTFLGNRGGLQAAVTDICDVFCELPQLRRINVSWYSSCAFDETVAYASPPRHDIPVLLRPLEEVRRALPGVIINMPVDSPVSTTPLAQQQTNSGFKNSL